MRIQLRVHATHRKEPAMAFRSTVQTRCRALAGGMLLKPQGYVTAQLGKHHLGDRNEFLP
jgi:arylsulfatase A-like enzyme